MKLTTFLTCLFFSFFSGAQNIGEQNIIKSTPPLYIEEPITSEGTSLLKDKKENIKSNKPNILLIISEDNSPNLGSYGDPIAVTPYLDKLASEGVLFENAYVTQSVCSSSRSTIFTGLYPHQNGQIGLATHQYEMFSNWNTSYKLLKETGYSTGLIGKTHINPESLVEDYVDMRFQKGSNFAKKNLGAYSEKAGEFMRSSNDPFFLTVNFPDAHWPVQNQVEGRPANPIDKESIKTIPFIGTTSPDILNSLQGYYNCMKRLDECVGELLSELEKSGKAENTVVIYISDHGAQMARGKLTPLEGGMKIPCIIKWPGITKKGTTTKALWSTIDLLPTLLDISGSDIPSYLPGKSSKPLLEYKTSSEQYRKYLFTERNSDGVVFYFPQRSVRNAQYKLIWSPIQDRPNPAAEFYLNHKRPHYLGSPTFTELTSLSIKIQTAYKTWVHPPKYQLYDLINDPWEFNNLVDNGNYKEIKQELIQQLENWQHLTHDYAHKPKLLKKLTDEHDELLKINKRSPDEGWNYLNYLNQKN